MTLNNYCTRNISNHVEFQYLAEELGKAGFTLDKKLYNPDEYVFRNSGRYKDYSVVLNKIGMTCSVYCKGVLVNDDANRALEVSTMIG